jgi:carbamoyl-phosphate synthase large subunit
MRNLKIVITGVGAPGISGTIYSLKNNYDSRSINLVGTDISSDAVGKYFCNKFYQIPNANSKEDYLKALSNIVDIEKPDVIMPQNTSELETLAENKELFEKRGVKIVVSNKGSIVKSNNKFYLLNLCRDNNISYPEFRIANNITDLKNSIKELGWPSKRVIVKPPVSNGMRGFRIIDEHIDHKKSFYSEKPDNSIIRLAELENILGYDFPELLVTEFLPGEEYSVDIFRTKDRVNVIPRKRTKIRSGITFNGILEKNEEIINVSTKLSELLDMEFCYGLQFKMDSSNKPQLLECNPRVQGTMVMSTIAGANLIYSAVKYSLNETIPEFNIDWKSSFYRYWGGIGINGNEVKII